ncbi:hypothetical protein [Flagellimonas onchidii]|uniref:hypothetical protein n=1 Tax=Flagellimonas onchidii TaxID=2562684 RepID=UPI0014562276|nr:hypothetical protein [Allomuricauda onchidii]
MKAVLLCIAVLFSFMALLGCTNDEGENDLDFITPDEEEQTSFTSQDLEQE